VSTLDYPFNGQASRIIWGLELIGDMNTIFQVKPESLMRVFASNKAQ